MTRKKDPLRILVTNEVDGYTYRLHPLHQERVQEVLTGQRFPTLYLSQDTQENFQAVHDPIAEHLLALLMGLTIEQAKALGGVCFVKSGSEKVLFS